MYPTDLTDSRWEVIKSLIDDQRKRKYSLRSVLNGIFYINRSGCQWRMLPKEYPPFAVCFYYYRKWARDGTWQRLNATLVSYFRETQQRNASPSLGIIDSQSVKNSERGVLDKGFDGNKRIQGRKRHLVTDTQGNILTVVVHPANWHDSKGAYSVFQQLNNLSFNRIKTILADKAYQGKLVTWVKNTFSWKLEIIETKKIKTDFNVVPKRWVVERTISWLMWSRRLSKDYECELNSSESQVYIANLYRCLLKF